MVNDLDELRNLIDYIQNEYNAITDYWLRITHSDINLKRSRVCDIEIDGDIYSGILEYVRLLNERSAAITLKLPSVCARQVSARVKAQNSIEYKIGNYKTSKHGFGEVAINKCINDLFGARIILESPKTFEEIYAFVQDSFETKYKCIDSSKGNYKAVHLYFNRDNTTFPWELQIWNSCDVEANFTSHKQYKQEYTTWESKIKEGGIFNG